MTIESVARTAVAATDETSSDRRKARLKLKIIREQLEAVRRARDELDRP